MNVLGAVRNVGKLIYPPRCIGCDEVLAEEMRDGGICRACRPLIHPVKEPLCKKCGKQIYHADRTYCMDCDTRPHVYTEGRGVFLYEGPMKQAMYRLKYGNRRGVAEVIAREALRNHGRWIASIQPEALVPVPIHRNKRVKRGYNQAEVMAQAISRQTGIPVVPLVERTVDTLPQKELTPEKRAKNLKNAFKVGKNGVKFKRILIIDDIYTTGATVDAMAGILLDRGIDEVYCLYGCIGQGY